METDTLKDLRLSSLLSLLLCFVNMCLGIYVLMLSFTIDLCRVESQHSVVLHREKRRWISGTFQISEEDPGPYPKKAIKLSNDKSKNHTILFSIKGQGVDTEPEKGLFSIDRETGQIFIHHKVDHEKTKELTFQVDALDINTLEVLDDHMLYRIMVIDINDNAPEFKQEIYKVDVKENTHPGEEIFRIEAIDPDDVRRGNGKVSYSIVSQSPSIPSNVFKINSEDGSILLQKCLDYDTIKSYSLIIKARDNGLNVLSSNAEVQINVIDSNTHPPIATEQAVSVSIDEDDNDIFLLRVSVTDNDTPQTPAWKVKYTIVEGNEDENFKIETDPETNDGILFLIKSLDYERGPVRKVRITAENEEPFFTCPEINGNASKGLSELTAVVTVKDKNDPPVFLPPVLTVQEVEGQEPGKILGRFNATDTDEFFKHSIRYVKGPEPAEWIAVDSDTGVISTVKKLDRESPYVNNSVYTFTVYAVEDGEIPTTGTGTMSLSLIDVNDNLPYLVKSSQAMCDDGEVPNIIITAQDDDLDPFSGPFTFGLLDNEQNIKDNWELTKASDNAALLVRKKKIPIGNYSVPLKIHDRQGRAQERSLNLRICHCLDGKTCHVLKPGTTALAGPGIGLLFAGLLLLLLGFCLFMFCTFTIKKAPFPLPIDEPMWTLVNYNNEGGHAESQTIPIDHSPQLVFNDAGVDAGRKLSNNSNMQKYAQAVQTEKDVFPYDGGSSKQSNTSQGHGLNPWANWRYLETSSYVGGPSRYPSHSYDSKAWDSRRDSECLPYGGSILRPINKLQGHGTKTWAHRQYLELDINDLEVNYEPRVYSYEEDELREPSLDAISIVESSNASDYLNNLGSMFVTLARICQEK
ncbi:cadherin-like protein 26 isoform X1 [Carcharodon carcharias]|uniref:cadherin-like protein 26 isoform X1 n=1 Tax=Carcharodon carcharias TaxID=13397 RepID=UPI001B7DFB3C|nr:cadherin-like protein 26 isoform X1 [Carcharodon carcharias]